MIQEGGPLDGRSVVQLEKPGEEPYVFRELPPGAGDAEVEEALIDAQLRADQFNALLGRRG